MTTNELKMRIVFLLISVLCITFIVDGSTFSLLPCKGNHLGLLNEDCVSCISCPPGTQPNAKICEEGRLKVPWKRNCIKCPRGYYSNEQGVNKCNKCTNCEDLNRVIERRCTRKSDSKCGICKRGYYQLSQSNGNVREECFQCSTPITHSMCLWDKQVLTEPLKTMETDLSDKQVLNIGIGPGEITPEYQIMKNHHEDMKIKKPQFSQYTTAVIIISGVVLTLVFFSCAIGCLLLVVFYCCCANGRKSGAHGTTSITDDSSTSVRTNRGTSVRWSKCPTTTTDVTNSDVTTDDSIISHHLCYHSDGASHQDGDARRNESDRGVVPLIVDVIQPPQPDGSNGNGSNGTASTRTASTMPFDEQQQASSSSQAISSPSSSSSGRDADFEDSPLLPRRIPVSDAYSSMEGGLGDDQQAN